MAGSLTGNAASDGRHMQNLRGGRLETEPAARYLPRQVVTGLPWALTAPNEENS
jgi:hypothetical protein